LGGGVKVGEGFVEDEDLWILQEAGGDAYFELVAFGEVADKFAAFEDAAGEKGFEGLQVFVYVGPGAVIQVAYEVEIFFGGKVVDEEAFVQVGGGIFFPVFCVGDVAFVGQDLAFVCSYEVEQETEEGGLSCAVVADEADHFSLADLELLDIDYDIVIVGFDEAIDGYHAYLF